MTKTALDIGGANIKIAVGEGKVDTHTFELWKYPTGLSKKLRQIIPKETGCLLITMTGELCDCFPSKKTGVLHILNSLPKIKGKTLVWTIQNEFVGLEKAKQFPLNAASANWLALASFTGKLFSNDNGLSIDIGSTTTDITPIINGKPKPMGKNDPERLESNELIYTGIFRTPLCCYSGNGSAKEFFATMGDAHLILGNIKENPDVNSTADGLPFTLQNSFRRVGRMKCADLIQWGTPSIKKFCGRAADRQISEVAEGIQEVIRKSRIRPDWVSLSGSGEVLARLALKKINLTPIGGVFSFAKTFSPEISSAACAYSLLNLGTIK